MEDIDAQPTIRAIAAPEELESYEEAFVGYDSALVEGVYGGTRWKRVMQGHSWNVSRRKN